MGYCDQSDFLGSLHHGGVDLEPLLLWAADALAGDAFVWLVLAVLVAVLKVVAPRLMARETGEAAPRRARPWSKELRYPRRVGEQRGECMAEEKPLASWIGKKVIVGTNDPDPFHGPLFDVNDLGVVIHYLQNLDEIDERRLAGRI